MKPHKMTTGLLTDIYTEMKSTNPINLSMGSEDVDVLLSARGVYGIHNKDTGGIYIGSSNRSIKGRLLEHRKALEALRHDNWRMMEEYNPANMEVRVFTYTNNNSVPEYVIEVLEQVAISAFPLDILYNQNVIYPREKQINNIKTEYKDLLYQLVNNLRSLYAWHINQCLNTKKPPRMLLSTVIMGGDLKQLDLQPTTLLSSILED